MLIVASHRIRRTRVLLESATRHQDAKQSVVGIKIGGSLFTSPELIERMTWLLAERADQRPLLICGGGAAADAVRRWQKLHDVSDEQAHWLCLSAMAFNEQLLRSVLPRAVLVDGPDELQQAWRDDLLPVLQCREFLWQRDPIETQVNGTYWDITSDSIAAICARACGADELILAKSVDLPARLTAEAAAAAGLVDAAFARFSAGLPVTWTNLRAPQPAIMSWLLP